MSGGIAFIYDADGTFERHCNTSGVIVEATAGDDRKQLKELLRKHVAFTGSDIAAHLLDDWAMSVKNFVTVVPKEYRQILAKSRAEGAEADADAGAMSRDARLYAVDAGAGKVAEADKVAMSGAEAGNVALLPAGRGA
jgi:glutamate synthase (NADPH/NADH) large chain